MAQVILLTPTTRALDTPFFMVVRFDEPVCVGVYAEDGSPQDIGAKLFKIVSGIPQDTHTAVGVYPHVIVSEPGEYFVSKPATDKPHGIFFETQGAW